MTLARGMEVAPAAAAPGGAANLAEAGRAAHGFFWDYQSLLAALRECRERRDLSCERLDEIAGLPKGLSSKVLSPNSERKITLQNLTWILAGLGVRCQLVDDADLLRQINGRLVARNPGVVRNGAVHIVLSRRFFSKIGRKGAAARNAQRKRRSEIGRKAALARWHGRANTGGQ
jgi:hypothetical protein